MTHPYVLLRPADYEMINVLKHQMRESNGIPVFASSLGLLEPIKSDQIPTPEIITSPSIDKNLDTVSESSDVPDHPNSCQTHDPTVDNTSITNLDLDFFSSKESGLNSKTSSVPRVSSECLNHL